MICSFADVRSMYDDGKNYGRLQSKCNAFFLIGQLVEFNNFHG
jgi:hypothetical protein